MNTVVYSPRLNQLPARTATARSQDVTPAVEETEATPALLEAFDWMGCSRHEFSLPTLAQ